jgi:hypothetical protein
MAKPFTKKGWYAFITIAAIIDGLQLLIDLIPGIGEAINAVLDIVIGILFALIYWRKRAISFSTFIGLLLTFGAEEGTLTVGPFWWADVTYTMFKAEAAKQSGIVGVISRAALEGSGPSGAPSAPTPMNQNGVRLPQNRHLKPLNQGNVRLPLNDMPIKSVADTDETLAA